MKENFCSECGTNLRKITSKKEVIKKAFKKEAVAVDEDFFEMLEDDLGRAKNALLKDKNEEKCVSFLKVLQSDIEVVIDEFENGGEKVIEEPLEEIIEEPKEDDLGLDDIK